ncbi:MAG: P1 family peptidase [Minwuia sp.]|uniref:P1 family peptidase n=1 Tax=Minwuia sp. TaxID=2493630 RepID=UPI003A88ADD6
MATGAKNLITDVPGLMIGNAEDMAAITGVTVILPDEPAVAAADVRGGGPGTREIDVMDPANLVEQIHGICLSGGSAFGLDAAGGVMSRLEAARRGFPIGGFHVPIVPSAILFDLMNGGDKAWGEDPPYRDLGKKAVDNAAVEFALGNAGAGLGATAGPLKGGLGSASIVLDNAVTVGAIVAANPTGSVVMPDGRTFWAWALEEGDEFGGNPPPAARGQGDVALANTLPGANTTIACVATDATLSKGQAKRVATMAHDGFARAIRPVHTPFDGDTVFALSTAKRPAPDPAGLSQIGAAAADCLARAIARAVWLAEDVGGMRSYRSSVR